MSTEDSRITQLYPDAPTEKSALSSTPSTDSRVDQLYGNRTAPVVKSAATKAASTTNEQRAAALYGDRPAVPTSPVAALKQSAQIASQRALSMYEPAPVEEPASMVVPATEAEPAPVETVEPVAAEVAESVEAVPTRNPYALENSIEDELYGFNERTSLGDNLDLSVIYEDAEQQAALGENLEYMAAAVGIDQDHVHSVLATVNDELLSGVQHDPQETYHGLYKDFGPKLHQQLQDAKDLVSSMPDLADYLEITGLGNSPGMIRQLIKIAKTPRSQTRLAQLRSKS